jgi:Tfp pilus assembly protein PilF
MIWRLFSQCFRSGFAFCALLTVGLASPHDGKGPTRFDLIGEVRLTETQKVRKLAAYVGIQGNDVAYSKYTWTGFDGKFKFKEIPIGFYTLYVEFRRRGEKRLTVEVSPSLADRHGRIRQDVNVPMSNSLVTKQKADLVSLRELEISQKARQMSLQAEKRLAKGDVKGSVKLLSQAVKVAPRYVSAINRLGTLFQIDKDFGQAERYFRQALECDPDAYAPLVNLGGVLLSQDRNQEALEINLRAVSARPSDAQANAQLGTTYARLRQDDRAMNYLLRAKEIDRSHFTFPQLLLADIYHRQNKPNLELEELLEFVKLHPDRAEPYQLEKRLDSLQTGH